MNVITAYIILILMIVFVILEFYYIIWWMNKNNILVQVSEFKDGVMLGGGRRYRIVDVPSPPVKQEEDTKPINKFKAFFTLKKSIPKVQKADVKTTKKLYSILDIFKKRPLKIKYDEYKDKFISAEGIPLIGIKRILKLDKTGNDTYEAWLPSLELDDDKSIIKNTIMSWADSTREELYENTKPELTRNEQLARLMIPMGLIMLAMACIIFFPKMYNAVMQHGNSIANSAIDKFSSTLDKYVPLG